MDDQRQYKKMRIALGLACLFCLGLATNVLADVSPHLQQVIRENTFEVVMKKPENDPVSYEKPLPLDLLPYIERTDAYRSVGTAFALGNNVYVTAGHVFLAGIDSQYGPPALRRSDGTVFEVERILKFSVHEDFVVFSLRKDPAPAGLATNRDPKLDEVVLAVGNALGEGIVVRDGLFTSETPEAQDGRWKWIRFSAAASPGNSGGPLCDGDGKVIGIVIGKSPNENLNYSLPIARVLDGEAMKARFDQKTLATLPYMHGTMTYAYKDQFDLPLAWPAFVDAFQKLGLRHYEDAAGQLLKTYADSLFPKGPGAQALLYEPVVGEAKPRLITQQADGTWVAELRAFHEIDLPGDGSVGYADEAGVRLLSLVRSGAASDDAFYSDSKAFMDLALKTLDLRRAVGADQVRVTSLGSAKSDIVFVDPYGRKWQERVWAIPFLDAYMVAELLPTPEGYAGIVFMTPSATLPEFKGMAHLLLPQFDVSYRGTLAQWRAALGRPALLPTALSRVMLDKTTVWTLRTPRFISSVPADVLALTDKSPLTVTMGFMQEGPHVVWDAQGVVWNQDNRKDVAVDLWRRARPPEGAKLDLRNRFDSISQRRSPYDGSLNRDSIEVYSVSNVLDVPGTKQGTVSSDLEYGLTVRLVGHPTSTGAAASLSRVAEVTRVLERGYGTDIAKESKPGPDLDAMIDELEHEVSGKVNQTDSVLGKDVRGKLMSEDLHDYMTILKKDAQGISAKSSQTEKAAWLDGQKEHLGWFVTYWIQVPALMHNRVMFYAFLEKNHMPSTTLHGPTVVRAESELIAALNNPVPTEEWPERETHLIQAYIAERRALVKDGNLNSPAVPLQPRSSACPPPASSTTGTAYPRFASNPQDLNYYWPSESKRLGEEGTVIASIHISTTGCVTGMSIAGSSGSDMLDHAVLKYLESATFTPAGPDGKAVESTVKLPIVFKLN
jgi:serine protease Do